MHRAGWIHCWYKQVWPYWKVTLTNASSGFGSTFLHASHSRFQTYFLQQYPKLHPISHWLFSGRLKGMVQIQRMDLFAVLGLKVKLSCLVVELAVLRQVSFLCMMKGWAPRLRDTTNSSSELATLGSVKQKDVWNSFSNLNVSVEAAIRHLCEM